MEKKFSEGFMQDLGDLMKMCAEADTDNFTLKMDINGKTLGIDITFFIVESDWNEVE